MRYAHISVALRARRCSIVPPKGTIRIESSDEILYPRGSSIYAASLGKANMRRAHTAPLGAGHFICPPGPLRGTKSGRRCPFGARAIYAQRGPFGATSKAGPKGGPKGHLFRFSLPLRGKSEAGRKAEPKGSEASIGFADILALRRLLASPIYARSAYCTFRCWRTTWEAAQRGPKGPSGQERAYPWAP